MARSRAGGVPRALLESRQPAACTMSSTSITCAGRVDASDPAEPDPRGRRACRSRSIDGDVARAIVATVERELLTPIGLRTLAPGDPAYRPRYEGGVAIATAPITRARCGRGSSVAFVDAWLAVNGDDAAHRAEARARVSSHRCRRTSRVAGLGHVCEIADGDPPHTPRGCPFQAWSLGELIRAQAATKG